MQKEKVKYKVISTRNKGRYKIKCVKCKFINFYEKDDLIAENEKQILVCESCGKFIELKKKK